MEKSERIIISIVAVAFATMLLGPMIGGRNPSTVAWLISLAIGLVIGMVAYYLIGVSQKQRSTKQTKAATLTLAPVLPAGETLRAFTFGYTGPSRTGIALFLGFLGDLIINAPRRKWYHVGLTAHYLLLVQGTIKQPNNVVQVLRRSDIHELRFEGGFWKDTKLIIQLPAERMDVRVDSEMISHAKELAAAWNNTPA